MKKIWILTPLLLGVAMVGCSKPQAEIGARSDRAAGTTNETHAELSTVDESLTQVPLEEFEARPKDKKYSNSSAAPQDMESAGGMMMGGEGQQQGQAGMSGSGPHPFQSNLSDDASGYSGQAIREMAEQSTPAPDGLSSQLDGQPMSGERDLSLSADLAKQLPQLEKSAKEAEQVQDFRYAAPGGEAKKSDAAKAQTEAPLGVGMNINGPVAGDPAARVASNPVPATKPADQMELRRSRFGVELQEHKEGWLAGDGVGPGESGDKFEPIEENNFIAVADQPLSTFSIDVDTASYSKIRSYLNQFGQLPPRDSVRVEELVNYFTYDYATPTDKHPFAANVEVASCPWNPANRLVRVGIKGKEVNTEERPASNLVFLLDVSGSMNNPNKLPLLKKGMKMLVDQLGENDKVSIVVYAGAAGMVLEPTYGYEKATILAALDRLQAGGSTNGGQGIKLAYKTATENFIQGGTNRVILCTDGDFNVGETSTGGLVGMAAEQAKKNIYLSVMGFGIGNHNDSMLEQLSNKANGNYSFIDNEKEARKVLVEQMSGTLLTIAKDVKIQIEFNPKKVASYRLVGYENRLLAAQDFNDDKKDAGEIGAGHTVTAFYEVVPAQGDGNTEVAAVDPKVDELKYQTKPETTEAADTNELMTLKLRYKQPEEDVSTLMTYPVVDNGNKFNQATGDFQFASAVAMFGLKLRGSHFHHETNFAEIEELVASNVDGPGSSYRKEFLDMIRQVESIQK